MSGERVITTTNENVDHCTDPITDFQFHLREIYEKIGINLELPLQALQLLQEISTSLERALK